MTTLPLAAAPTRAGSAARSGHLAPSCRGLNFYEIDRSLRSLLPLYMDRALLAHLESHLARLGELAGGHLGTLSDTAERHGPVLHQRDPLGRDEEWVEFHPAYREMEDIAFGQFGMHAMSHRPGVLGWPAPMPPIAKASFHYLFTQAQFGLLCPINLTDSSSELVRRFGSPEIKARYLERLWSQDLGQLHRCAQFMTEKAGGSDVGAAELTAVRDGEHWRLWGEKWFCSNVDAELAVLLARPEGAPAGGKGLGLFLMPKTLEGETRDGTRNAYRIVRLKDKLGSRSMASGEIVFEGALAYQLGELDQGLKQMLVMVNSSRASHLTRAAGMMRRCLHEALVASRNRSAFGRAVSEHPLMRRQLLKLMLPTEQALSAMMYACWASDGQHEKILRILTPIAKYRACRDNVTVATGAMEARGGNGYIEDWPNARLVRDAHLGLIWEGTSNINALDAIQRAVGTVGAHRALSEDLSRRLNEASLPAPFRKRLEDAVKDAFRFAEEVASDAANERFCRTAAGQLYHATTAVLMAAEGCELGRTGGDARRMLLARLVLEHRMHSSRPLSVAGLGWEEKVSDLLLSDEPVPLEAANQAVVA